ncbi:MAG: hypothetical protein EYC68_15055 [Chloroflexota bacterium]|nr:MAG: hypothetical protein EYC68_15055 [Chloroflexota bacterium]
MTHKLAFALRLLVIAQILAGVVNIFLLAPTWMQLLHLLLADLVWIVMVLYAASLLAVESEPARESISSNALRAPAG